MVQTSFLQITCEEFPQLTGNYQSSTINHWNSIDSKNLLFFDSSLYRWIIQDSESLLLQSQLSSCHLSRLSQLTWYLGCLLYTSPSPRD